MDLQGLSQDQSCLSETIIRTRGTMPPTGSKLTSTVLELRRQVLTGCCQGGGRGNGVYGQLHGQLQFGGKKSRSRNERSSLRERTER